MTELSCKETSLRKPKRIVKKNFFDYSWKANPNAVYVGRGRGEVGKWGNPFRIEGADTKENREKCLQKYHIYLKERLVDEPDFIEPLRGKDLVCFCKLDKLCHADILLKVANEVLKHD